MMTLFLETSVSKINIKVKKWQIRIKKNKHNKVKNKKSRKKSSPNLKPLKIRTYYHSRKKMMTKKMKLIK